MTRCVKRRLPIGSGGTRFTAALGESRLDATLELHELQHAISELVVHGARNQPSERSGIVVEIYLPNILAQSQNTFLIFLTNSRSVRPLDRDPLGTQAIWDGALPIRPFQAC
jgi:hypothetical protein